MKTLRRRVVVDALIATAKYYKSKGVETEVAADLPLVLALVELLDNLLEDKMPETETDKVREHESYLLKRMDEFGIPEYMQMGLLKYIIDGRATGHFLQAVLENNLASAVNRGDDVNQKALHNYVKFLHNCAPNGCWGREGVMQYWKDRGGLRAVLEATK